MNVVDAQKHPELHPWLRAAYEDYLTELVSFGADMTREPGGFWQPDYFDYWLTESSCHPLVVPETGFAFVGNREFQYRSHETDFILCEFCIIPSARGRGAGRALAQYVFGRWPGSWELSVLNGNAPALRFWRSVLPGAAEHPREETFIDFLFQSPR